jgi:hypothetical protein
MPRGKLALLVVLAAAALSATHMASLRATARAEELAPRVPVLVELFTSEGCSSCPPAEEALSRLDDDQPVSGVRVVPIAFHVDYWNQLGWTDPFSSEAWSARQGEYARSHDGRVYTPEAVVQGGSNCTGSDGGCLRGLLRAAAMAPPVRIDVAPSTAPAAKGMLRVAVRVTPPVTQAWLRVALVERGLSVDVRAGENAGRRLRHAPVARDLQTPGVVGVSGGAFDVALTVPATSRPENLRVVAFLQETGTAKVTGVGTFAPPP